VHRDIKLLAIDLDGTTVQHDTEISPRVLATLRRAMDAGVRVVIATGRNIPGVRHFAERMGISGPAVAQQGGLIFDLDSGVELRRLHLPHALACELVDLEHVRPDLHTVLYKHDRLFVTNAEYFAVSAHLVGFAPTHAPDLCAVIAGEDPDKVLFMVEPEQTASVLTEITTLVGARATVVQSHAQFVEVNPLGADKGSGLAWLANHLGIAREHVMAIGDQHNDSTMLQWAGFSVAMGNAREDLKALADWVAPTVEEDGAAVAIEQFVLAGRE
jgi:Cof subfamily protein (haloacid dehalogenase superfamily)